MSGSVEAFTQQQLPPVEGKDFPFSSAPGFFVRGGVYAARLSTGGEAGALTGGSALGGVGWEFDAGGIGIAPEFAWRLGRVARGVRFSGAAPAVGLHFYRAL